MHRVLIFHGTTNPDLEIRDDLIGYGGDPSSALGMFFDLKPETAADYGEMARRIEGGQDARVIVAEAAIEADRELGGLAQFLGWDNPVDGDWDHERFATMRRRLLDEGYNAYDWSDECETHFIVLLEPESDAEVLGTISLSEAAELAERFDDELGGPLAGEQHFEAARRMALEYVHPEAVADHRDAPGCAPSVSPQ